MAAVGAGAGPSGERDVTIPGRDGNPVTFPMALKQAGGALNGPVRAAERRQDEPRERQADGTDLSWIVKRDRPDGSLMTYRMSGSVKPDGTLAGQAKTEFDGNEVDAPRTAKRK